MAEAIGAARGRAADARPRIYAPGCAGESFTFRDALVENAELAADVDFLGVWIPGVNHTDYAGLHPTAGSELIFLAPAFRKSFARGAAHFLPLTYTQAWRWLGGTPIDAAIVQTTTPDARGLVSLGVSADFSPAVVARRDVFKVAQVNSEMPRPGKGPTFPLEAFDAVVEKASPLLTYDPQPLPPVFEAIAEHIATHINDGDTLQFGLGNVQLAVLRTLAGRRNLKIHSGMVADPVLEAIEAGAISQAKGAITTGVALGSPRLYAHAARDERFRFEPVGFTHAIETLSKIENFVAINSVIEVDLLGQANAEFIGGRQVSGGGGLLDFLRGAAASRGGKPIIALASRTSKGASRIVPKLASPAVTVGRSDVAIVTTEFGGVDLRGLDIEKRAEALIAIAHPDCRADLMDAWRKMREAF